METISITVGNKTETFVIRDRRDVERIIRILLQAINQKNLELQLFSKRAQTEITTPGRQATYDQLIALVREMRSYFDKIDELNEILARLELAQMPAPLDGPEAQR